jgi:3-deoxy-D-manno-octulosonic-acid transferase
MLVIFYDIFLTLATPFIILRLLWKSRKLPDYRRRISERFSCKISSDLPVDVLIHAVSMGEVVAATKIIKLLLAQKKTVAVTTMTPTGSLQISKTFGNSVLHQYLPYDLPWIIRKFFKILQPKTLIILETELWPNLILQASKCNIPIILVNGRISDKAFKSYNKTTWFFKPIIRKISTIFTQSPTDTKRFQTLGALDTQIITAGNIKFDLELPNLDEASAKAFHNIIGTNRIVFTLASTHAGEESAFLELLPKLQELMPNILLLIAPRHPERFDEVYNLALTYKYKVCKKSAITDNQEYQVIILDSMGELMHFYALSAYAFVGGSLVNIGGHNLLEPISLQIPTFCGPYMQNARSIYEDLIAAGGLTKTLNADAIADTIATYENNPETRKLQVSNALGVLQANRGKLQIILEEIMKYLH